MTFSDCDVALSFVRRMGEDQKIDIAYRARTKRLPGADSLTRQALPKTVIVRGSDDCPARTKFLAELAAKRNGNP